MIKFLMRSEGMVLTLEKGAIFVVFVGLVAALFLQVLFRFVIEAPLGFTEELSRVLIVWLVFLSAAHAIHKAEHFVVDVVINLLPTSLSGPIAYVVDAICIAFMIAAAWVSYRTTFGGAGQILPTLHVSVIVQTLAMPIGFTLMTYHALLLILRRRHLGEPAIANAPDLAAPDARPS